MVAAKDRVRPWLWILGIAFLASFLFSLSTSPDLWLWWDAFVKKLGRAFSDLESFHVLCVGLIGLGLLFLALRSLADLNRAVALVGLGVLGFGFVVHDDLHYGGLQELFTVPF